MGWRSRTPSWRSPDHPLSRHKRRTSSSKQLQDMSPNELFRVADKANREGVQALKDKKNLTIAKLTSRLRSAELRADRECTRADKAESQLDKALLRALKAEARCEELSDISVKEVLQFVIKNSNTARKTMGKEVRPH